MQDGKAFSQGTTWQCQNSSNSHVSFQVLELAVWPSGILFQVLIIWDPFYTSITSVDHNSLDSSSYRELIHLFYKWARSLHKLVVTFFCDAVVICTGPCADCKGSCLTVLFALCLLLIHWIGSQSSIYPHTHTHSNNNNNCSFCVLFSLV